MFRECPGTRDERFSLVIMHYFYCSTIRCVLLHLLELDANIHTNL